MKMLLDRVVLTLVFTLSFLSYMTPDLSVSAQLAPLALFLAFTFLRVLFSKSFVDALWSLFQVDALIFIFGVCILVVAVSAESDSSSSFAFSLLMSSCLVLARLYMAIVPIQEVFEAFFWSGVLSVAAFVPLSLTPFIHSVESVERFSVFSFHPNLLALVLAGYFCAAVWKVLVGNWYMRILSSLIGVICLGVIFFASSRGSIVALFFGGIAISLFMMIRAGDRARRKVLRFGLSTIILALVLFPFARGLTWTNNAYEFVDKVLQLSQEYRGLDTGLTGRVSKWDATLRALSDGSWLLGHGIRTSDSMEDQLIDNSYLVSLYETGIFVVVLITWRYLKLLRTFVKSYLNSTSKDEQCFFLACSFLMIVFLTNNIVARFLLSIGNPYSLLCLLFFVTPTALIQPESSSLGRPMAFIPAVLGTHGRQPSQYRT